MRTVTIALMLLMLLCVLAPVGSLIFEAWWRARRPRLVAVYEPRSRRRKAKARREPYERTDA